MPSPLDETYRQHRTAQDKYAYFLLAAAGASVAFSMQRTAGSPLSYFSILFGLAVLCWGVSFWCGCQRLRYVEAVLFLNMNILEIERGLNPRAQTREDINLAIADLDPAMKSASEKSGRYAQWQFRLLIVGALFFIAWHVTEMAVVTFDKQEQVAPDEKVNDSDKPND